MRRGKLDSITREERRANERHVVTPPLSAMPRPRPARHVRAVWRRQAEVRVPVRALVDGRGQEEAKGRCLMLNQLKADWYATQVANELAEQTPK